MSRLTWEEKFAAICALRAACLMMRKPGDWYVSQSYLDVKETENPGVLVHRYGNGSTPEAAIEDHFRALTAEQPLAYVVLSSRWPEDPRRHVLWNGYMWVDVPLPASRPSAGGRQP